MIQMTQKKDQKNDANNRAKKKLQTNYVITWLLNIDIFVYQLRIAKKK